MSEEDYINVDRGVQSIFKRFRTELVKTEQEHVKAFKPYCARAAKMNYEEIVNKRLKQLGKREDQVTDKDLNLDKFDFTKYGNMKDFELQSTQDAIDNVRVGIGSKQVLIGYYENYVHKPTGSGVSVFIPKDVYEGRNKGKDARKNSQNVLVDEE